MTATSRGTPLLDTVTVMLGGLIATLIAWPIYQHPQALVVGAVGTVVGAGIALGGRMLGLRWWIDALVAVLAYVVIAVPLAVAWLFPGRWLDGLRDAVLGVVLGWKQLVTLDLPLGDYQAVLVPLLVVTLFGTYAATRIAGAGRAAILTPLILFAMAGVGIAFGTSEIHSSVPFRQLGALPGIGSPQVGHVLIGAVVILLVVVIVWFRLRARQSRRAALAQAAGVAQSSVRVHRGSIGAHARRGGLAAAMVLVALAVAGGIAIPTLELDRTVVRDGMQPLAVVTPESSALGAYRQWFQDERFDVELFAVQADSSVERLRLVVLDQYDGTRFLVGDPEGASRFTRLAGVAGPGARSATEVRIEVLDGYAGPWLPLPGDLASTVEFPVDRDRAIDLEDRVYYAIDGSSVVVLGTDGGAGGLQAGDVATVTGRLVTDARTKIAGASGGDPLRNVDQDTHPELVRWLESQQARVGGQGLLDVIDALRARGYLSHALVTDAEARWAQDAASRVSGFELQESRSGHSIARLEALFAQLTERQRQVVGAGGVIDPDLDQALLVAGIGDDEQFAAAGALLAWALGFDARVVVGVHLDATEAMRPPGGGPPAVEPCAERDGLAVCAGRNTAAWIEVRVGDEWVPLDTSPQFEHLPQENLEGEQPPPHGTQPERPVSAIVDPPNAAPTEGDPGSAPDDPPGVLPAALTPVIRIVALSAAALGFAMLPPLVLLGAKAFRRARRQAGDPETSVVGAWDELVDLAVDHRALRGSEGGPEGVPVGATRRWLAERIGVEGAADLADLADLAVFGERTPVESQAQEAWALVASARARLRVGVPFLQRVRAALDPTSLLRRLAGGGPGAGSARASGLGPTGGRSAVVPRGVRLAGEVR